MQQNTYNMENLKDTQVPQTDSEPETDFESEIETEPEVEAEIEPQPGHSIFSKNTSKNNSDNESQTSTSSRNKRHLICLDDSNTPKQKKTAITIRNTHTLSPINLSRLYNLIDEIYKPKTSQPLNLRQEFMKILENHDFLDACNSDALSEVTYLCFVSKKG